MRNSALAGCLLALSLGACQAPADAPTEKLTVQDVKGLWDQVITAGEACDTAGKAVVAAADKRDVYELYPVLKDGIEGCRTSYQATSELKPPAAATGEVKDAFKEAIDTCGMAHINKQMAFEAMAKVVDGDQRPSAVAEARSQAETAQMGQLACAAGFMKATDKAGFQLTEVFGGHTEKATEKAD